MRTGNALWTMSLATVLGLLTGPWMASADNVVAEDQIVQGNLCVGTPCVDGETFTNGGEVLIKGFSPRIRMEDTNDAVSWTAVIHPTFGFRIGQIFGNTTFFPLLIASGAPAGAFRVGPDGNVGIGIPEGDPTQRLHVRRNQDANTFLVIQNSTNALSSAAVIRTQADTAMQNFQSHASSRTLVRWGVPLGGWNEFLSVVGNGLAMGTFNPAPFILGTAATPRMTFDGDSNTIDFGGGGQYNGASFLDASSRTLKQDIQPLGPAAAADALAGLEPVTFAYTGNPGDGRVGFIAEDVPELVATPGRQTLSALEIVAVLTKVVQEQQKTVGEQQRVMREQEKALQEQQQVAQAQQRAIAELTARLTALEARP